MSKNIQSIRIHVFPGPNFKDFNFVVDTNYIPIPLRKTSVLVKKVKGKDKVAYKHRNSAAVIFVNEC